MSDPFSFDDPSEPRLEDLPEVRRKRRRQAIVALVLVGALVAGGGAGLWSLFAAQQAANGTGAEPPSDIPPAEEPPADPDPAPQPEPSAEPPEDPSTEPPAEPLPIWDIDSPGSTTVVVNKRRQLQPKDWAPADLVMPDVPNTNGQPLRKPAARAIERMHAAASAAGAPFVIASGYRPYQMQVELFQSYVDRDGVEAAETYSARPGHSEHQTGLVADVDDGSGCAFEFCFGDTAAGTWLRKNAYRYGFIVRYPKGQQRVTGYIYEPYHLRYIGKKAARLMHEQRVKTLEGFFGLEPAPTY